MPCLLLAGRTSGRTAAPGIDVEGTHYPLKGCDGGGGGIKAATNLHGGMSWNKAVWTILAQTPASLTLGLSCEDGSDGFPGALEVQLTYEIVGGSELWLDYSAVPTKPTPVSLTNHAYFNLSAGAEATMLSHTLQLNCQSFNPDDGSGDGCPSGEYRSVVGTRRDLRSPTSMKDVVEGQAADAPHWLHGEQFVCAGEERGDPNATAASALASGCAMHLPLVGVLAHSESGRAMSMLSSEPVVQTYYATLLGDCLGC